MNSWTDIWTSQSIDATCATKFCTSLLIYSNKCQSNEGSRIKCMHSGHIQLACTDIPSCPPRVPGQKAICRPARVPLTAGTKFLPTTVRQGKEGCHLHWWQGWCCLQDLQQRRKLIPMLIHHSAGTSYQITMLCHFMDKQQTQLVLPIHYDCVLSGADQ